MTRILHASIPADRPAEAASLLARIMGGTAMPFPPGGPNAWIAWADDGRTEIEVVRRGDCLERGPVEAEWRSSSLGTGRSEVHLALAVPLAVDEILALAREAHWPARICSRGGLFELVELWVEGAFLIELFDPDQAARFTEVISASQWAALLAAGPAPQPQPA
jgi:hypothetical protein